LSLPAALSLAHQLDTKHQKKVWVIGGSKLYQQALQHPQCRGLVLSRLHFLEPKKYDCFFPAIPRERFVPLASTAGQITSDGSTLLCFQRWIPRAPKFRVTNVLLLVLFWLLIFFLFSLNHK
jgi:dihydrofolate reductase